MRANKGDDLQLGDAPGKGVTLRLGCLAYTRLHRLRHTVSLPLCRQAPTTAPSWPMSPRPCTPPRWWTAARASWWLIGDTCVKTWVQGRLAVDLRPRGYGLISENGRAACKLAAHASGLSLLLMLAPLLPLAQAGEPLGRFLDYCTYGHMIDNVVLIVTGTLHERDVQVGGAGCPGAFDSRAPCLSLARGNPCLARASSASASPAGCTLAAYSPLALQGRARCFCCWRRAPGCAVWPSCHHTSCQLPYILPSALLTLSTTSGAAGKVQPAGHV